MPYNTRNQKKAENANTLNPPERAESPHSNHEPSPPAPETSELETGRVSPSQTDRDSEPLSSWSPSPGRTPSPEPQDMNSAQSARSQNWQPWQDRALVDRVYALETHLAPHGHTAQAWATLADSLKDVTKGKLDKNGKACQERFKKVLAAHRQEKTRSLQKTGTNEEVTSHGEKLNEIVELLDDHKLRDKQRTEKARNKVNEEKKAGEEMRRSSMRGMVVRDTLTADLGELEGATGREKSGQRKSTKRKILGDSSYINISDDEGAQPARKPSKRMKGSVSDLLEMRRQEEDSALQDARAHADRQHKEQIGALTALTESVKNLESRTE
ncbi:hypothetical protein SISNIDRAFT_463519 [Sistotremastrum niveocremeum HHB9708]|uniref:Myb-like domain-containing protein n=1 Tax=Sistotremastrum niveocremeum HHB9708 TaxID=1314777 RepID=A0A164YBE8_9AGAM|nr:hypothetical protein SISNIDRAFT_463519 [Sistotremastrum niveocremeum HHB9708]